MENTLTERERAEIRLAKAKEKLAEAKKKEADHRKKERTTALVTVGACWASLLESNPDLAMQLWTKYLQGAAPRDYFKSGRIEALRNQFNLNVKMSTPPPAD